MIGSSKMGHVFPGATSPFGMVQVSPQINFVKIHAKNGSYNKDTYEYCSGYQYSDSTIIGFAHNNFSGTGHSDLGDILIMPVVGTNSLEPIGNKSKKGFYSVFDHSTETATPGYYSVMLDSYNIKAELSASERVGFHRYTFPQSSQSRVVLDMVYNVYHHNDKNVWTSIRVENDSCITGYRQTTGWARDRKVFFAIKFSKAFKSYGYNRYDTVKYDGFYRKFKQSQNFPEMAGRELRAYFDFNTANSEQIMLKVALSSVSTQGAMMNLESEVPHWDFDKLKAETKDKWNKELSKIKIEAQSREDMVNFYTALYHSCLSPIIYQDIDGSYRGLDQNINRAEDFQNYTVFSLWDTSRPLHPLFNLIQPKRNNDMIKSMLAHYQQSVHHMLPICSHYANENWCMIGYHAASLIADATVKKIQKNNISKGLKAIKICTTKLAAF